MSVNEQNNCDMSHRTHFHTHQPKYQENVLAMQQFVKSKQFNPHTTVFCKEQPNENSWIVENNSIPFLSKDLLL